VPADYVGKLDQNACVDAAGPAIVAGPGWNVLISRRFTADGFALRAKPRDTAGRGGGLVSMEYLRASRDAQSGLKTLCPVRRASFCAVCRMRAQEPKSGKLETDVTAPDYPPFTVTQGVRMTSLSAGEQNLLDPIPQQGARSVGRR